MMAQTCSDFVDTQVIPVVDQLDKHDRELLTKLMKDADIDRDASYITNAFMSVRPKGNDIFFFFVGIQKATKENIPYCDDLPRYKGKYLREYYRFELKRLRQEIEDLNPRVIVPLGGTAMWMCKVGDKITSSRGKVYYSQTFMRDVIPTFHPAAARMDKRKMVNIVDDLMLAKNYIRDSNAL